MKFLCEQCKAKYQIADDKVVGKTVRMKCRKCGHMIEVRAEVTETGVASDRPSQPGGGAPPGPPRPPPRAPAPRATALAASLTSPRPMAPKGGALAGAFRTTVQHEDEVSAPFDMSELAPSDDWYVAINGVPVGPVRVAEVRRKAALGAVTEDSLVWQEGLDEWRPLRSFPDLAAIVRGALGGRTSTTPAPPEGRVSGPPVGRGSVRPTPSFVPQRPTPPRTASFGATPPPRNNVVAISSRLATAEKLSEPAIFAPPAPSTQAPAQVGADVPIVAPASLAPVIKKDTPWMPIMMVVMGLGFSITLGITLTPKIAELLHPSAPTPVSAPVASASSLAPTTPAPPPQPTAEPAFPTAGPSTPRAVPGGAVARATPAPTSTGRSLDLHGLGGTAVALGEDPSGDGPKPAGQCLSEGQVQKVVQLHIVAVRRTCWERSQSSKPSVNVNVALTVGADGSAQGVSASGDDPIVAKCIENDVRGWRFPAMGCTQRTSIPFKFLLQ